LAKQALIAALVGFLIGVVPSLALQPVVARAGLKMIVPPMFVVLALIGTLVFCLVAALVSFRKVAKIDPALVFRG